MKKLVYIFLSLLTISTVAISQDDKKQLQSQVAAVTSYTPSADQALIYSSTVVDDMQRRVSVEERIQINSVLQGKINITVSATRAGVKVSQDATLDWEGIPQNVFENLCKRFTPTTKTLTVSGLTFTYVEISLGEMVYWFSTDPAGKNSVFPGVLKISRRHDDHEHVDMILTRIEVKKAK